MSKVWLARAPEAAAVDGHWAWLDTASTDGGVRHGPLEALREDIVAAPRRQPLVVLLPAGDVLACPVNAPARQQRQLQQALPFLLEEMLAGDIDEFHVVAGRRIDPQRLQVLAVERRRLRAVLAALQHAGLDPAIVTSEALALPVPERGIALLLAGADSLVAGSDGHALGLDAGDATLVLDRVAADAAQAVVLLAGDEDAALRAEALEAALQAAEVPPRVERDARVQASLNWLAPQAGSLSALNLRQGEFAAAGDGGFDPGFDWQPLAWLAASWAVLALGYQVALGISHEREATAVREAQVALYRQAFPGAGDVPRPRAQMEGHLRTAAGAGAGLIPLVAETSAALAGLDADQSLFTPRNLSWDSTQAKLHVDIVARSLEDLDRLRQALEQRGLVVDLGAGIAQDTGYKARLNVAHGNGNGKGGA